MQVKSTSKSSSGEESGAVAFPSFILLSSIHFAQASCTLWLSAPAIQPPPLSRSVDCSSSSPHFIASSSPCLHSPSAWLSVLITCTGLPLELQGKVHSSGFLSFVIPPFQCCLLMCLPHLLSSSPPCSLQFHKAVSLCFLLCRSLLSSCFQAMHYFHFIIFMLTNKLFAMKYVIASVFFFFLFFRHFFFFTFQIFLCLEQAEMELELLQCINER